MRTQYRNKKLLDINGPFGSSLLPGRAGFTDYGRAAWLPQVRAPPAIAYSRLWRFNHQFATARESWSHKLVGISGIVTRTLYSPSSES